MRLAAAPLAAAAALLILFAAAPPARAAGWGEADYWRFADRVQERVDVYWISRRGLYRPGDSSSDTMVNANMLLVHSTAALRGHDGPARQDDRARAIATRMVQAPPFVEVIDRQFGQQHAPGWSGSMTNPAGMQHLLVDAEVAEALAAAWRAREVLGLDPNVVAQIQDRLHRVATSRFWRYPALRLNQFNWNAAIYTAAAEVTGDLSLLHNDLRAQAARFVRGVRRPPPGGAGNLGPGMRFHYLPERHKGWELNLDSAEYANIVAAFTRFWGPARQRGMRPLALADRQLLQRWMRRVLAGYWTHAGYLNWDTGFGFRRLHQAKKIGLAQAALLGIAAGGELTPGGDWPAWAKHMLDAGFALYERWLPAGEGLVPALLLHLSAHPTTASHAVLAATRMEANAARAIAAGLAGRPSAEPPPLYSFDPDVGRLAVTTPRYSTAIVAVNQGAFPYGGLDLARLFDGRQEVAANIGGVPPAAFGLIVSGASGDVELATQRARREPPATLRLLEAPEGVGAKPGSPPDLPFAGPFRRLRATGATSRGRLQARATYRFTRDTIRVRWSLRARDRRRHTVRAHFPSWAGDGAGRISATLTDGRRLALEGAARVRLEAVDHFTIASERGGYRVRATGAPRGATALVLQPEPQSSAPRPGPTLALELAHRTRVRDVSVEARITVLP